MFGVSVIVGVLCTVFIWPLVRSRLAAARERNEELIRNADPETRSALEFNQPPHWMRAGRVGGAVQFILILIPVTVVVYLIFSRL